MNQQALLSPKMLKDLKLYYDRVIRFNNRPIRQFKKDEINS